MSRGPGRIERAIRQLFDENPARAFPSFLLVYDCFPEVEEPGRKHEVSVLRAAHKIVAADPDWAVQRYLGDWNKAPRRFLVFFNRANLQSYSHAQRLISHRWFAPLTDYDRAQLEPDGAWSLAVELHCAVRAGNASLAAELEARQRAAKARRQAGIVRLRAELFQQPEARPHYVLPAIQAGMQATHTDIAARAEKYAELLAQLPQSQGAPAYMLPPAQLAKQATLIDVAAKARSLMQINDPDAIRAGLAEIADALDAMSKPAERPEAA